MIHQKLVFVFFLLMIIEVCGMKRYNGLKNMKRFFAFAFYPKAGLIVCTFFLIIINVFLITMMMRIPKE